MMIDAADAVGQTQNRAHIAREVAGEPRQVQPAESAAPIVGKNS